MEDSYWVWLRKSFIGVLKAIKGCLVDPITEIVPSIVVACFVIGWFGFGVRSLLTLFVLLLFFPITHGIYRNQRSGRDW